jgi:serine/threonine-protein kinase RIM15
MGPPSTSNRRSSRLFLDEHVDPIMTALYDIIAVATDVLDTSITQLTNQPKFCEQVVQRLQKIGKTWDEHPDWHGRTWYVQVLLAVASLSRVVEWWEAEKQFWNFDDNEEEQDEPLLFVTKPVEHQLTVPQTPSRTYPRAGSEGPIGDSGGFSLITPDSRLKLHKTRSVGRKSRDDMPKDQFSLTPFSRELMPQSPMPKYEQAESARVLATERLRLQAETTQNQNIVLELGLDGDHIQWVNYAWAIVVGYVPVLSCLILELKFSRVFLGLNQRM